MKKYLFFAASAALLMACSEKPGYEIAGTVSNADLNGKYVYLSKFGIPNQIIDSALIQNGAFILKGIQDVPEMTVISVADAGDNAPLSTTFLLENGKLNVVLDAVSSVTGTPENDAQTALQAEINTLRTGMEQIYADLKSADENIAKSAERKYDEINSKITEKVASYILANTDKKTAAKNLYDFRHSLSEDQQNEIIAKADSNFKSVPGIDKLIDHLNVLKTVAVGNKFVDFEMADAKGEMHKLSEYVGNGKDVVLIDFWASWCPPCRRDMPFLVETYKTFKNKGFEIVGISLDNKADAWEKGTKELNITWTQLSDLQGWKNAGASLYGVNSIPHTVLVDKDGTILAKNLHGEELTAKLREVIK